MFFIIVVGYVGGVAADADDQYSVSAQPEYWTNGGELAQCTIAKIFTADVFCG